MLLDPVLKDHFWMNPFGKHFSCMKASDLVLVDDEGYVTEGGAQLPINEAGFMIHSEIHKARPDVMAAAHTHGVYGKTWSAFGKNIEMLTQGNRISNMFISQLIVCINRCLQLAWQGWCIPKSWRYCTLSG